MAKAGRPTKFDESKIEQGKKLAEKGLTDKDIAEVWGLHVDTIHNWKKKFPRFFDSLKKGKEISDANVVKSLYQRATGYSHPETILHNYQGKIIKTEIIKHYPPDPTSCFYWLGNRRPDDWKSVNHIEKSQPSNVDEYFKEIAAAIRNSDG